MSAELGPFLIVQPRKGVLAPGKQLKRRLKFISKKRRPFRKAKYAVFGSLVPDTSISPEDTVSAINLAPVANAGPDFRSRVGDPVVVDGSNSSDENLDSLSYSWLLLNAPNGSEATLSVEPSNPSGVDFTPDVLGEYVIQLIVNDGELSSAADTVTVTARENALPSIVSSAPSQGSVGDPYRYTVVATDEDNDDFEYFLSGEAPADMSIDSEGNLLWLPDASFEGSTLEFEVSVSDGQLGGMVSENVTLFVGPANGPLVSIPEIIGLDQFSAGAELVAAGLAIGSTLFQNDDVVPTGLVLAQDLAAGRQALIGTALTVTVSLGPDPSGSLPDPSLLPAVDEIVLRNTTQSYNTKYVVVVIDQRIYIAPREGGSDWRELRVPPELDGNVFGVSLDDQLLVAIDEQRNIYSLGLDVVSLSFATAVNAVGRHDLAAFWRSSNQASSELVTSVRGMRRELDAFVERPELWTKAWGSPFAQGPGISLPEDTTAWSLSVVSPWEDGYYTDAGGRKQNIGGANCTTVFALNGGGKHITVLDPWLPIDYSYSVGLPRRNSFIATGLSTSGSTLFIIDGKGEMWTRRYDFDMSGSDFPFFPAAYDYRLAPPFPLSLKSIVDSQIPGSKNVFAGPPNAAIQLPLRGPDPANPDEYWTRQPDIFDEGTILFDGISIEKTIDPSDPAGLPIPGAQARTLRVPALKTVGGVNQTGYYEKGIEDASWTFYPFAFRNDELPGKPITGVPPTPTPAATATYRGSVFNMQISLEDFIVNSPPAKLRVQTRSKSHLLKLHFYDGLRQVGVNVDSNGVSISDETRRGPSGGRELDGQERVMYGTVEVPQQLINEQLSDPLGETGQMLWTLFWSSAGNTCPSGYDNELGLCYPKCGSGFSGAGPLCFQGCPANFVDTGLHCLKPAAYGRGVGYALWDLAGCERRHGRGGCERYGLLYYPKCAAGFYNFGCCICTPNCPGGMRDIGVSCEKSSYLRGLGQLFVSPLIPFEMRITASQVTFKPTIIGPFAAPGWVLLRN
ncbi:MAG: PASTA domain-containing protein [Bdellovibrionales bacterium]|nr:PASTA domain-containing protein [Bdellovibrionales bacterium]